MKLLINFDRSLINKSLFILWILITLVCFSTGCRKLVEVDGPPTSINKDNVYESDITAASVLNGIYAKMSSSSLVDAVSINGFMSLYPGLSADELTLYNTGDGSLQAYYTNTLTSTTSPNIWSNTYPFIYTVNSAIEGLNSSSGLTPSVKKQLLGEAKFLRAFYYFYLTNLYGDVPLVLNTDYKTNSTLPRANHSDIYKQIILDLTEAKELLSETYLDLGVRKATTERIAPIKWAAVALLARVYLFNKDYINAEANATLVINQTSLYTLPEVDQVFISNSSEAIWQLQPVNSGWNTEDARLFVLPSTGPGDSWPVYLSNSVVKAFEPGDMRRNNWIDSVVVDNEVYYYPYKYKNAEPNSGITEYQMVLRLAEQYLIRSEARANQGKVEEAIDDLNLIKSRANINTYNGAQTKDEIINSILQERQIEFFSEWGHRWLDLKRLDKINDIMPGITMVKGGTWTSSDQLYPISNYELKYNNNIKQNDGY